jgi:hypothetical protein
MSRLTALPRFSVGFPAEPHRINAKVKVDVPSPQRPTGAPGSRTNLAEITRPFFLTTATDYYPAKIGLLIAHYRGGLGSREDPDPVPTRSLSFAGLSGRFDGGSKRTAVKRCWCRPALSLLSAGARIPSPIHMRTGHWTAHSVTQTPQLQPPISIPTSPPILTSS